MSTFSCFRGKFDICSSWWMNFNSYQANRTRSFCDKQVPDLQTFFRTNFCHRFASKRYVVASFKCLMCSIKLYVSYVYFSFQSRLCTQFCQFKLGEKRLLFSLSSNHSIEQRTDRQEKKEGNTNLGFKHGVVEKK